LKYDCHLQSIALAPEEVVEEGFFVGAFVGLRVGGFAAGVVGVVGTVAVPLTLVHLPKLSKVAVVRLLTAQQSFLPVVTHL